MRHIIDNGAINSGKIDTAEYNSSVMNDNVNIVKSLKDKEGIVDSSSIKSVQL